METNTSATREITLEEAHAFIQSLTPDHVLRAYSGKHGCMCGCLGKYYSNPLHNEELEERDRPKGNARSLLMIKKILDRLKAHPSASLQDGYIVYVPRDDEERNYIVYLCKSATLDCQCKSLTA